MPLIISERKCYSIDDPCVERIVEALRERNWEFDSLYNLDGGLCGAVGEIVLEVAKLLCSDDTDIADLTIEVSDPVKGLVMRGMLRMLGIAAKVRLKPGGGTTRADLERARRELRVLATFADV